MKIVGRVRELNPIHARPMHGMSSPRFFCGRGDFFHYRRRISSTRGSVVAQAAVNRPKALR
jgi:hypothetical protein